MQAKLAEIENHVWQVLTAATNDRQHALRYLTLATVTPENKPRARLLVLRDVQTEPRQIIFHTDIRSDKWRELCFNPSSSVIGFDPQSETQIRFEGNSQLFDAEAAINRTAWDGLSVWVQNTYCGGPPGESVSKEEMDLEAINQPTSEQLAQGRHRFGVIIFTPTKLDWFKLQRSNNKRAVFEYPLEGENPSAKWINP